MTSKADTRRAKQTRREHINQVRRDQARRERRWRNVVWVAVAAALAGLITTMLLTSRPESTAARRVAPDFTLTDTTGAQVRLSDYRGRNVVLYFNEGAGCQSCLVQMAEIERYAGKFADANVTVLPIVMNGRDQIIRDMRQNGVKTPFLLDDGRVSESYGTLGKGMHAGLPGHSFVLIDQAGVQRWYGEYPSMWLAPADLLAEIREHLAT